MFTNFLTFRSGLDLMLIKLKKLNSNANNNLWIYQVGRIGTNEVTNLEKHKMTDIQQHTGPFPESTPIISLINSSYPTPSCGHRI